ncbi:replication/maintenance protein RepL [Streptomyces mirabilis]
MAQRLRSSASAPSRRPPLAPVPEPKRDYVNGLESAAALLTKFKELSKGGTLTYDRKRRPYAFYGTNHHSVSDAIQANLWKFRLTMVARDVLDYMVTHHDKKGLVTTTQAKLGEHFCCSQTKVSKAIGELSRHNFTWKEKRGVYQLNPLYAFRWGSDKQRELVVELQDVLLEHQIEIPTVVKKEASR